MNEIRHEVAGKWMGILPCLGIDEQFLRKKHGPCPVCGGRDRFRVQPGAGRWLCRQCTGGKWRDVIAYIAQRDNLDAGHAAGLAEICKRITGGDLPNRPAGIRPLNSAA